MREMLKKMNDMKKYDQKESGGATIEEPAVAYSVLNAEMGNFSVCIPESDIEYLEEVAKTRGWIIKYKEERVEETRRRAIEAINSIRTRVAESDLPEMTLEEINAEIKAAREERKNGRK